MRAIINKNIAILPDGVINKIAAGEVVERPAAVVKELLENSIDSESAEINVDIEDGGISLIKITDDGSGMNKNDALLSIKRYATSKIHNVQDLDNLTSMGFRGEALPSIAAVSRLQLITADLEDGLGFKLVIEGGELNLQTEQARSQGTTVIVEDLFFNVPARKKFLKSPETEYRHIVRTFLHNAISHPQISFTLTSNGKEQYSFYPVEDMRDRLISIYGKKIMDNTLLIDDENSISKIRGYAGKPSISRNSTMHQLFYVNNRNISSRLIAHAISSAYGTLLQKGKYPFIILFLEIYDGQVDVNVHPTKREVRFSQESVIHQNILSAVRRALQGVEIIPNFENSIIDKPLINISDNKTDYKKRVTASIESFLQREIKANIKKSPQQTFLGNSPGLINTDPKHSENEIEFNNLPEDIQKIRPSETIKENLTHIWHLHNTFIFTQVKGGVLIFDQHLAHEAVLYHEALKNLAGSKNSSQQLLFPITIDLSTEDYLLTEEIKSLLEQIGFGLRYFGGNTVVIDAIPTSISSWNDGKLFKDIIDDLNSHGVITSGLKEKLALSYASRAAVKAGDELKLEEVEYIINKLFQTEDPYTCPHGKPTVIKMQLHELASRFKH